MNNHTEGVDLLLTTCREASGKVYSPLHSDFFFHFSNISINNLDEDIEEMPNEFSIDKTMETFLNMVGDKIRTPQDHERLETQVE